MSDNNFKALESSSVSAAKLSAWNNGGASGEKIPANVPTNPDGSAMVQALTDAELRASAVPVSASSLPLPSGAATESTLSTVSTELGHLTDHTQTTQITDASGTSVAVKSLATGIVGTDNALVVQSAIHGLTTGGGGGYVEVKVNPSGAMVTDASGSTVSVTSSALPTGASTSALQTTGNSSLNSIDTKTPALGQAISAASVPVVLPAAQITTLTPPTTVTVTQATGTNLHTVVDSGTVSVSNFPATQPVSATSLPLPTGAATEAKQPALGTAGTPSTDVITVQGATSMTALKVDGSAITQPVSGTVAVSTLPSLPTGSNTIGAISNTSFTATQATGTNLHTVVDSGTVTANAGTGTFAVSAASLPLPSGAATAANQASEITILNTIATNTGAQATDTLATGTITALSGAVAVNAQGAYTVSALVTGTWVATLVAEGLMADGTTWQQIPIYTVATTLPYIASLSTAANGSYVVTGGGYTQIRIRASAFTSGTVNVALNASLAQQTIFSAQLGDYFVRPKAIATYGAAVTALNAANTATDIFTIGGSATKTIKIKHISMDGTATTGAVANILLIKRSSANTGGTSTVATNVPYDSSDAAATATIRSYTANPTAVGTAVGTIHSEKMFISTATAVPDELKFDYTGIQAMKEITLRGATEFLCINLNGVTFAGNSFNIDVTWTEE